jgi:glycine cleavage system aminomethyltransferase T
MGYVRPDYREVGSVLEIVVRGKSVKAKVVKPPFVPKDWAVKQVVGNV